MIDAVNTYPSKKFVFIDSDVYLTANCDIITKYFKNLDYYPLINSHIHDVFYVYGYKDYYNEELVSPLHILLHEMGINETWKTSPEIEHKILLYLTQGQNGFLKNRLNFMKNTKIVGYLAYYLSTTKMLPM
jgi:hypothetical protein